MHIPDTTRLTFHFMTRDDKERFCELDRDPEVMKYVTGRPMTREDIEGTVLPRIAKYADRERGWGLWGMTRRDNGCYIGWVLVRPMHFFEPDRRDDTDLEIGWRLFRSEWGRGYATEGARAVVEALREHRACERVTAIAVKENTASTNVMTKLGMTFVREEVYDDPDLGDPICVVYSRSI